MSGAILDEVLNLKFTSRNLEGWQVFGGLVEPRVGSVVELSTADEAAGLVRADRLDG